MTAWPGPVRVPAGRDPLAAQGGGHGSARRHPRVGRGLLAGCTVRVTGRRRCSAAVVADPLRRIGSPDLPGSSDRVCALFRFRHTCRFPLNFFLALQTVQTILADNKIDITDGKVCTCLSSRVFNHI